MSQESFLKLVTTPIKNPLAKQPTSSITNQASNNFIQKITTPVPNPIKSSGSSGGQSSLTNITPPATIPLPTSNLNNITPPATIPLPTSNLNNVTPPAQTPAQIQQQINLQAETQQSYYNPNLVYNDGGYAVGVKADLGYGNKTYSIDEYNKRIAELEKVMPVTKYTDTNLKKLYTDEQTVNIGKLKVSSTPYKVYVNPETGEKIYDVVSYARENNIPLQTNQEQFNISKIINMKTTDSTYDIKSLPSAIKTPYLTNVQREQGLQTGGVNPITAGDIINLTGGGLALSKLGIGTAASFLFSSPITTVSGKAIDYIIPVQNTGFSSSGLIPQVARGGLFLATLPVTGKAYGFEIAKNLLEEPITTTKSLIEYTVKNPYEVITIARGIEIGKIIKERGFDSSKYGLIGEPKKVYTDEQVIASLKRLKESDLYEPTINVEELLKERIQIEAGIITNKVESNLPKGVKFDETTRNFIEGQIGIRLREEIPEARKIALEKARQLSLRELTTKNIENQLGQINVRLIPDKIIENIEPSITDISLEVFNEKKRINKAKESLLSGKSKVPLSDIDKNFIRGQLKLNLERKLNPEVKKPKKVEPITYGVDLDALEVKLRQQIARFKSGADIIDVGKSGEVNIKDTTLKQIEKPLEIYQKALDKIAELKKERTKKVIKEFRQEQNIRKEIRQEEEFKEVQIGRQILLQKMEEPKLILKEKLIEPKLKQSVASKSLEKEELKTIQLIQERQKLRLGFAYSSKQQEKSMLNSQQIYSTKQLEKQLQKEIQLEVPKSASSTKLSQPLIEISLEKLSQPQMFRQPQAERQMERTSYSFDRILEEPKRKKRFVVGDRNKFSALKQSATFNLFIRRKRKYVPVATDLTESQAKRMGADLTLNEIARTFKITPTGKSKETFGDTEPFMPNDNVFRSYKVRKGKAIPLQNTFIQKSSQNLKSRGEKEDLRLAREMKRLTGFSY